MPRAQPPAPSPVSFEDLADADLVQACRTGHQGAWATLVRRFQRLIYTVPRRAGLPDDAAADVFQATFARLHQHLGRLDDASRVRAWLVTTAKRETLRVLAERQRHAPAPHFGPTTNADGDELPDALANLPDPAPLQDERLAELQLWHRARDAVDRLDPRSRQLVELLFLEDPPLTYAEVAARLGMAEGSIGPIRARCLARLRQLMAQR